MSFDTATGYDRRLVANTLKHRWPILVLALLVGAALGLGFGKTRPQTFQSTSTLIVNPMEGNPYSPESIAQRSDANTSVQTDARLAATPAVAGLVEHSLHLVSGSLQWPSRLAVTVVPNSQVITVTYRSKSGAKAESIAESFAESYLNYRVQRSQESVSSQLAALDERSQQVQKTLTDAAKKLNAAKNRADRTFLNQQVTTYTEQLAAIAAESAQLASASRDPGQVLSPATSASVTGLSPSTYGAIGAIVVLLLGLVIAVAREIADRRVHEPSAIEEAGVPVLGRLRLTRQAAAAGDQPAAADVEQYRVLRTAVAARATTPCVVMLSSLTGGPDTGEAAMRLGRSLARAGSDVTVVLAWPYGSGEDDQGDDRPGLSDVLLDELDVLVARETVENGLHVLSAGNDLATAAERFIGSRMRTALKRLVDHSEYVVIAAPPASTADAHALASICEYTILFCELHRSTRSELTTTIRDLQRVGGEILGVVTTQQPRQRFLRRARHLGPNFRPAASAGLAARSTVDRIRHDRPAHGPASAVAAPDDAEPSAQRRSV